MSEADPKILDDANTAGCDLSVVVPVHNASATLSQQCDALGSQIWDGRWEIVLVDNRSTDDSLLIAAEAQHRDSRIRIVHASERGGIGYARNVGIAQSFGASIAMCDSDDEVGPGWIAAIGEALKQHQFVTGPIDVHSLNEPWLQRTRGLAIESGSGNFMGMFPFAHSCNVAFQRSLIDTIGGFDETLVNGSDVEFSFRAWHAGIPLHYVEEALVAYRYRDTLRGLWHQARNYARAKPLLMQHFSTFGVVVPASSQWRGWVWLVRKLFFLRTREGRARWVWNAGLRFGHVLGVVAVRRQQRAAPDPT